MTISLKWQRRVLREARPFLWSTTSWASGTCSSKFSTTKATTSSSRRTLPKPVRRAGPEALIDLAQSLIENRPEIACASEMRPWDIHEEQISTFRRGERVPRVFLPEPEDVNALDYAFF
mgnify:CR=1 FL=1